MKTLLVLKIVVLVAGLVGFISGIAMLLFFEKFMKFNNYMNQRFFVGRRYDYHNIKGDDFFFARKYIMAVFLTVSGAILLTIFIKYLPY